MNKTTLRKMETLWPLRIDGQSTGYESLVDRTESLLSELGIPSPVFNHVGIVVGDLEVSVPALLQAFGTELALMEKVWVDAYHLYNMRASLGGFRFEFIQPVEDSLFLDFYRRMGETLHHLAFFTTDIHLSFSILKQNGISISDGRIQRGLNGDLIFFETSSLNPVSVELCQPRPEE